MEITANIDIDEIISEVCDSVEFDRRVDDKLDDMGVSKIDDHESRLDDIESRLDDVDPEELAEIIRDEIANAGVNAAVNVTLEDRVARLEATVARQTEALDAAAKLIRALA